MKNAIYLQYEWFSGDAALSDDQRNDFIYLLQENGLNQQFCDIGVINDNGSLPAAGTVDLKDWVHMSRVVDPNQKIVLVLNYGKRKGSQKFGTPIFNSNLNIAVRELLRVYKPDGIHFDIEGFVPDDKKLLALLKIIKKTLGNLHLSISTPATVWSVPFIKLIGDVVDQVNPMIYDTMGWGSPVVDEDSFKSYFRDKLLMYSNALWGTDCELVPTLPSYELKTAEDGTVYHDPDVETMGAAIEVLNELRNSGSKLDGAGIFWGSNYLGFYPNVYSKFDKDQELWTKNWMNR